MGLKVLPNETVKFNLVGQDFNTFNQACMQDNDYWCQLAEPQVITQFEGELTPLNNVNELLNSNFTNLTSWNVISGGWNYNNPGTSGYTSPGVTFANLTQTVSFSTKVYRFSVQVSSAINANLNLFLVGAYQALSNVSFFNVTPGYYEVYFLADSVLTTGVSIVVSSSDSISIGYVTFTSAQLIEMSTPVVAIYDCAGVFQANISTIEYSSNKFAVSVNWGELGLTEGCYGICLSDVDDLGHDLLLPSLFIIASNGNPIIASQGATNATTVTSLMDRANNRIQPIARQTNRTPMGIKAFG